MSTSTLGLYVHLPWCVRKCPYCDFNSHTLRGHIPEAAYVEALLADLTADLQAIPDGQQIHSIFIGGGTPSLFSAAGIGRLLAGAAALIPFKADLEITLECNPGSADANNFAGYRAAGVNRLSIGVQTFDDKHLQSIGRIHDATEAVTAVTAARQAGFDNLNLDLMYGLPDQTESEAISDIYRAMELSVEHISHYQLTLEPNTRFAKYPPSLPDEARVEAMEQLCRDALLVAGYERYEISAFAAPNRRSQHNLNYWRFGDYLGIGAGAHSKLHDPDGDQWRRAKLAHPQDYLAKAASPKRIARERKLSPTEMPLEFLLNHGRLLGPFSAEAFQAATGQRPALTSRPWLEAQRLDLLTCGEDGWQVTDRGHRYLNDLLVLFMPEEADAAPPGSPNPAHSHTPYAHLGPRLP
jgi:putative oxygen-independent coproporphyrinogen III oxidase